MTNVEKYKLQDVCRKSKLGIATSVELKYAEEMLIKYPDEYEEIHRQGSQQAIQQYKQFF